MNFVKINFHKSCRTVTTSQAQRTLLAYPLTSSRGRTSFMISCRRRRISLVLYTRIWQSRITARDHHASNRFAQLVLASTLTFIARGWLRAGGLIRSGRWESKRIRGSRGSSRSWRWCSLICNRSSHRRYPETSSRRSNKAESEWSQWLMLTTMGWSMSFPRSRRNPRISQRSILNQLFKVWQVSSTILKS